MTVRDPAQAVKRLAMESREFFAGLLENPRQAIREAVATELLDLEEAEIEAVANLIDDWRRGAREDALAVWDKVHEEWQTRSPEWRTGPWPEWQ